MDFYSVSNETYPNYVYNPYASQTEDGNWVEGYTSIDFLNNNFGQFETATEMKNATTSEGLKLYFDWLVEQGKIPK